MEILFGIILIVAGGYFALFYRKKVAAETLEIQSQDTKTVAEVREALEAMSSIDPNYREQVEVKGIARSEQPVYAPYTGEQVAFYRARTERITETTETYRDSKGDRHTRTVKHIDILSQEQSYVPLLLRDSNGDELMIETDDAASKLDLQKTCDRMEQGNMGYGNGVNTSFGRVTVHIGDRSRLVGHRKVEETFRVGAPLYALGEAYMHGGRVCLGVPKSSDMPFIVTTKSEQQLVKSKKNAQNFALYGGIAAAVIGLILIVVQIVN